MGALLQREKKHTLFSWSGFLMLLRSDWLILSVKDWCCINRSVSVSLSSPLPEPPGYFISDWQHKQEPGVTQVPDGAEQTSICASWDAYLHPVRAGLSGQHWSGAGTSGDSGPTNARP